MSNPIRVVVPIDCHDPSAWATALAYAEAIGTKAQPPAREYILLTHTKSQLTQTSLGNHVGSAETKLLLANQSIPVAEGGNLRHATLQTLRGSARQAVIVAYFAEDEMMEKVDGLAGVIGVVVVPDFPTDVDNWSARWNPRVHGQQPTAPVKLLADAVVEKALRGLSGLVNLSKAAINPRDKEHANDTLRILRAKGHTLDAGKIKSWAIQNGWQANAADELAKLAAKIQALRSRPSTKAFHDAEGRYQRWNE
ncbi:MAG: hypothetical protein ACRC14_09865 [Paracoccaceae bacterium]